MGPRLIRAARTTCTFARVMPEQAAGFGNQRFATSPAVTLVNRAACWTAGLFMAAGWASWALTFTPWSAWMPDWYFVPFFVLMFPLFAWAMIVLNGGKRTRRAVSWDALNLALPGWMRPVAVAGVAAVVASFLIAASGLPGQPEYDADSHRYVFDNHGQLIPTTHAAYLHAVAAQNRLFLGMGILFLSLAFGVTYRERGRRAPHRTGPPVTIGAGR